MIERRRTAEPGDRGLTVRPASPAHMGCRPRSPARAAVSRLYESWTPARARLRRIRLALVLTLFAVALAAAAPAHARIVIQHGIDGVGLRMTKAHVRSKLGTPTRIRSGRNEFGRYVEFVYPRVTVSFQGGSRATGLRTRSPLERTGGGIGVGSTELQVKARVAGVRCRTESGFRHCFVGRFLPGRVVTDFHLRHGRVSSVVVGFVLD